MLHVLLNSKNDVPLYSQVSPLGTPFLPIQFVFVIFAYTCIRITPYNPPTSNFSFYFPNAIYGICDINPIRIEN